MKNTLGAIRLGCNYDFKQIDSIRIESEPNKHGFAVIKGVLKDYSVDTKSNIIERLKIYDISCDSPLLFSGLIDEVNIKHIGEVFNIEIKAFTCSIHMDITKRRRSFQNKPAPYTNLFDAVICDESKGLYIDMASGGRSQDRVIIQYDETNWAFINRVSSQFGAVVFPSLVSDKPAVYIGVPKSGTEKSSTYEFQVQKNIKEYNIASQNFEQRSESDYIDYTFESEEYLKIGTDVVFQGKKLTVYKLYIFSDKGVIKKKYVLRSRYGIYQNFIKNDRLTGLLIDGTVIDVQGDTIKSHLSIDKQQPIDEANWFRWNTAYTASGQTGLYLMPQVGDTVLLYIPESDEDKAYMRSIKRSDGDTNKKTSDTAVKYLGNPYSKEIKMAPGEVLITTTPGQMYVKMTDKDGIEVESNKDIQVISKEDITLRGKTIKMAAKEYLHYKVSDESSLSMDNLTHFKANKTIINGLIK